MQEEYKTLELRDIRSFGRIRARKRSARQDRLLQEVLPRYLLTHKFSQYGFLEPNFEKTYREIWLEIGFGGAEHLIRKAQQYPDVGFIGSETFEGGIIKALSALENENIKNVLLFNADVRPLLRVMPASYFSRIFILFPDPWPKVRHAKRRLVNFDFVDILAKVMRPKAKLHIATDIKPYARDIFNILTQHSSFVSQRWDEEQFNKPWEDWCGTRYAVKALKQGRAPLFLTFLRTFS